MHAINLHHSGIVLGPDASHRNPPTYNSISWLLQQSRRLDANIYKNGQLHQFHSSRYAGLYTFTGDCLLLYWVHDALVSGSS